MLKIGLNQFTCTEGAAGSTYRGSKLLVDQPSIGLRLGVVQAVQPLAGLRERFLRISCCVNLVQAREGSEQSFGLTFRPTLHYITLFRYYELPLIVIDYD